MIKTTTINLIRSQLISCDHVLPFTEKIISRMYVNMELISLMEKILKGITDREQYYIVTLRLKKLVRQIKRHPGQEFLEQRRQDYLEHLLVIKSDQKANDPLKWLDAEIEYLQLLKEQEKIDNIKDIWLFEDVKRIFKCSKNKLYLLISEGMPTHKFGGSNIFFPDEVKAWIKDVRK